MRQFIAGVILGATAVVALGTATQRQGRYQIAVTSDFELHRAVIAILDTETQTVIVYKWFIGNIKDGTWTTLSKP